jgi:hypothetical protein
MMEHYQEPQKRIYTQLYGWVNEPYDTFCKCGKRWPCPEVVKNYGSDRPNPNFD